MDGWMGILRPFQQCLYFNHIRMMGRDIERLSEMESRLLLERALLTAGLEPGTARSAG